MRIQLILQELANRLRDLEMLVEISTLALKEV